MTRVERGGKVPNLYPRGDRRGFDNSFIKKAAFTLVEVLIVIGVIGIVAAMTIPNMITNIQDKQFKTALKKNYADIINAYRLAFPDPVYTPNPWDVGKQTHGAPYGADKLDVCFKLYEGLLSQLKLSSYCLDNNPDKTCSTVDKNYSMNFKCKALDLKETDKTWGTCFYESFAGYAILQNGAHLGFAKRSENPRVTIDVNGQNSGPNVVGRDIYILLFRNNTIIPAGHPDYPGKGCDKNVASENGALGAYTKTGSGCAYKYLREF
ncbi:MAG: type II secretion system protein [Cyanobacteria bacterium SIG26]|nr:type II secretion system protein [Cyanobacteria bacterium SIG26]